MTSATVCRDRELAIRTSKESLGDMSAGSSACLRLSPPFLCFPPASLHRVTPHRSCHPRNSLGLRSSVDPPLDDFVAQNSLKDGGGQEGRERDRNLGGRLRQWVCAAFSVSDCGDLPLLRVLPGKSPTPAGSTPGRRAERTGGVSLGSTLRGLDHTSQELQVSGNHPGTQVGTARDLGVQRSPLHAPRPAAVTQSPP